MNRGLGIFNLALLAALCGLWVLDRTLEARREARRAFDSRFHSLADSSTPPVAAVARIELLLPGSQTRWIAERRIEDRLPVPPPTTDAEGKTTTPTPPTSWRLPQYRDAYATGPEIDGLLKAFLDSKGTVVGTRSADSDHFGLTAGKTIELAVFGAGGKLLVKAAAGSIAPGQRSGECYLAADGFDRILHSNANPWPYVKWDPSSRFPPLTDLKVLPGAIGRGSVAKLVLGGEAAPAVRELIRREIPKERLGPMMDRGPRFEWFGVFADGEKRVNDTAAYTYLSGVTGMVYDELLGALSGREALVARPSLTIRLENDGGTTDTLSLGARDERGLYHLLNDTTAQVFLISASRAAALTPNVEALLAPAPQPPPAPPQPFPPQPLPPQPVPPQPPPAPR